MIVDKPDEDHEYEVAWVPGELVHEGKVREVYNLRVIWWRAPWYQEYDSRTNGNET